MAERLIDQLDFIRTASPKQLYERVQQKGFRLKAEMNLVQRKIHRVTLLYIQKYGLSSGAARVEVIRMNNRELIHAMLQNSSKTPEAIHDFLNHGNYQTIKDYLEHNHVPEYAEQYLVQKGTFSDLINFTRRHGLSPFAKYDLIMRGESPIIYYIINNVILDEREKFAIAYHCNKEEIDYLCADMRKSSTKDALTQIRLIRFGSQHQIKEFIKTKRFVKKAEDYFFEHGDIELLIQYIKHYNIEEGSKRVLERSHPKEIISYLSKNWLCESGEKLLLKRGNHLEIKAYIKKHNFTDENEVHFIKRGKHREIMLYLANHSLNDQAQKELFYRRHNDEILYFITHYPVADIAEPIFMKCATDEAIDVYMNSHIGPQN